MLSNSCWPTFVCRVSAALGIFRELIPIRTRKTRVTFWDPPAGSKNYDCSVNSILIKECITKKILNHEQLVNIFKHREVVSLMKNITLISTGSRMNSPRACILQNITNTQQINSRVCGTSKRNMPFVTICVWL